MSGGRVRRWRLLVGACALAAECAAATLVLTPAEAAAQTVPVPPAPTTTSQPPDDPVAVQIEALNQRVDDLRSTQNAVLAAMAIFVTLIAGGGFVGLATSMRAERRSEKRTIASHELGLRGESSAQQRAEDSYQAFQESSQRTVSLVNHTLDLARQVTRTRVGPPDPLGRPWTFRGNRTDPAPGHQPSRLPATHRVASHLGKRPFQRPPDVERRRAPSATIC